MEPEKDSANETPKGDQNPLPVAESTAKQPTIEPVAPVEPVPAQNKLHAQPAQQQAAEERHEAPEPLLVRIIEDDELSKFERKTIRYGGLGIFVAFLALVAACVTAYFIDGQFQEMTKQTCILAESLKKQKEDSAASAIATGQQLAILQNQLTQQRMAMEMDQRPWLKFELGGERPKDADPSNGKLRLLTTTAGQPIKVEVRVTNVGRTTAEKILGTLVVQYVPKGGKPVVPKKENRIVFTEGRKREGSLPGTAWREATLYPNEVSQDSFSRSRWGKNGTVEDDPITQSEKSELDNGNAYILLLGEVWYSDVFGVRHWTKFCEMSSPQLDLSVAKKCVGFGGVDGSQPKADGQHPKAN